jgi:hypothetical protein
MNIICSYSYGYTTLSPSSAEQYAEHISATTTLWHRHFWTSFNPFQDDITDYTVMAEEVNTFLGRFLEDSC